MFTQQEKESSFLQLQEHMKGRFFIGRLSGNETRLAGLVLNNRLPDSGLIQNMLYGAGIQFKTKNDLKDYVQTYNNAVKNSTALGVWDGGMYKQAELYYNLIDKIYRMPRLCAHALEPYYFMKMKEYDFPSLFKNKKVLVITSHSQTTQKQIDKMDKGLFFEKPIFHETTKFYVYKPPQQNGGSHDNICWKEHFEKMKNDIKTIKDLVEFDVALVSCGGFGMLISDYIFSIGPNVIYVGGALQLFFGIIGSRWKMQTNENWVRPMDIDKPKNPEFCENSCYW